MPWRLHGKSLRIVGVVGNTRDEIAHDPWPIIYYPLFSGDQRFITLAIRSRRDAASLAPSVQKVIAEPGQHSPRRRRADHG